MPHFSVQGKKFNRVNSAVVHITHGDAKEAMQIPICEAVIQLPTDHDAFLAEWALSPHGPKRWKTVEVQTLDRSRAVNHTWTLHKAYVHKYIEREFDEVSGSATDQGTYRELTIRATLIHANVDYDGKNVLEVKAGEVEKLPG